MRKSERDRKTERETVGKKAVSDTKDSEIDLAVALGHITSDTTSGVQQPSNDRPQRTNGEQSDPGPAVEVAPSCPADEGLTSSGTMAQ